MRSININSKSFLFIPVLVLVLPIGPRLARLIRRTRPGGASSRLLVVHSLADLHGSIPGFRYGFPHVLDIIQFYVFVFPFLQVLQSLLDLFDLLVVQFASEFVQLFLS